MVIKNSCKYTILSACILFLFGCSSETTSNLELKNNCIIKEIDLVSQLSSIIKEEVDIINVSFSELMSFDSLYIFPPYTSIEKLELRFQCSFENYNYQDDDTWCLIVLKDKDKFNYSIVDRRFDLVNMVGDYSSLDVNSVIGIKEENKYVFRLKE